MRAEELVVFDNLRATLTIVTHAAIDDAADIARAKGRLDEIEDLLARALPANAPPVSGVAELPCESSSGFEPYRKMVRHVPDPKSVASGKRMSVCVELVGRGCIK